MADSLSRDFHLSEAELTSHITKRFLSQVTETFRIVPLPNKILSWMTSLLLTLPVNEQFMEANIPTKLAPGAWRQWTDYCTSVGLLGTNIFLSGFERQQRAKIIGAFANALREGRFVPGAPSALAASTRDTPTQREMMMDN